MSKISGFIGRHKILVALFIVVALGGSVAFAMGGKEAKTYSWRYKMTVEIETPEGLKTGSAVREVTITFVPTHDPDPQDPQYAVGQKMKGEAVVVDLGERGKVFAILKGPLLGMDYGSNIPFYVFPGPPGLTIEGAEFYSQLKAKAVLDPKQYPMFVTFGDIKHPETVTLVYGGRFDATTQKVIPVDDFETLFGKDIKLKNVTIEMTDEPVTWGVEKKLPWLPSRKQIRGYLGSSSAPPYDDPTKTYLNGVEFSVGKFW